jgi:hypothetical protein
VRKLLSLLRGLPPEGALARATRSVERTWDGEVAELGEGEWVPSTAAEAAAYFRAHREQ